MTEQEIYDRFGESLVRLDGDVTLLCEMAAMTAPDCPEVIERIKASFERGDGESAGRALHKLKGMLSTFDCDGIALEMQEMLEDVRHGRVDEAAVAFKQQEKRIRASVAEIAELASSL